jgi:hypothetical protein
MKNQEDAIIKHTKNWLSGFVIQHNICPFAKRVFDNNSIDYQLVFNDTLQGQLQSLIETCIKLDSDKTIETSLIIYPKGLGNFDDYLDFLALANALLHKQGYQGIYQLASFHPDYCFAGVAENDASNFTNRSPYPMLHLIREDSLENSLKHYPDPEHIPIRNIDYLRKMGLEKIKTLFARCFTQG